MNTGRITVADFHIAEVPSKKSQKPFPNDSQICSPTCGENRPGTLVRELMSVHSWGGWTLSAGLAISCRQGSRNRKIKGRSVYSDTLIHL